jgi:hypothetical protein
MIEYCGAIPKVVQYLLTALLNVALKDWPQSRLDSHLWTGDRIAVRGASPNERRGFRGALSVYLR